jgi:hypothetical protein
MQIIKSLNFLYSLKTVRRSLLGVELKPVRFGSTAAGSDPGNEVGSGLGFVIGSGVAGLVFSSPPGAPFAKHVSTDSHSAQFCPKDFSLKPPKTKLKIRTSPQYLSNLIPLFCSRNETSLITFNFVTIGDHGPNGIARNTNGIVSVVQNFLHSRNRGWLARVFIRSCDGCWGI